MGIGAEEQKRKFLLTSSPRFVSLCASGVLGHFCPQIITMVGAFFTAEVGMEGTGNSTPALSGTSDFCCHTHPALGCHKSTCGKKMHLSNTSVDFSKQVAQAAHL